MRGAKRRAEENLHPLVTRDAVTHNNFHSSKSPTPVASAAPGHVSSFTSSTAAPAAAVAVPGPNVVAPGGGGKKVAASALSAPAPGGHDSDGDDDDRKPAAKAPGSPKVRTTNSHTAIPSNHALIHTPRTSPPLAAFRPRPPPRPAPLRRSAAAGSELPSRACTRKPFLWRGRQRLIPLHALLPRLFSRVWVLFPL